MAPYLLPDEPLATFKPVVRRAVAKPWVLPS
jgi:hypothetical protein